MTAYGMRRAKKVASLLAAGTFGRGRLNHSTPARRATRAQAIIHTALVASGTWRAVPGVRWTA